ncbi:MAG TPA: hypothetical protein VF303_03250 [Candidatus Nanoarchaeia archaeon]
MNNRGSKWRKWDLQVQTYLDPNWVWPSGYPSGNDKQDERISRFEKDFIQHCIVNKIEAVAITDHNTGEAVDGLLKASTSTGNKVFILPGVEVISTEGTHILVIFNPSETISNNRWLTWKDTVDHFLTAIFTDNPRFEQKYGRNTPLNSTSSIDQIIKKSEEFSAITIFPHVLSQNTGLFSCDSRTQKRALKLCNILDLACGLQEVKEKTQLVNNKLSGSSFNTNDFAFIRTSDSRKITDVGSKFTFIKAELSFEGLKQIIHEPKARVSIEANPPLYLYPQIVSTKLINTEPYQSKKEQFPPITLSKEMFFSPNLTTIIGPRASGKTLLVELVGFVGNQVSSEKRGEEKPLIDFLHDNFPELEVEISYKVGENEEKTEKRKISEFKDPFYNSPLKIEYWPQGYIERSASSQSQIADYIRERIESKFLVEKEEAIKNLREQLREIREKCSKKLELEIEKQKLVSESKQIEAYFEKLKSKKYKDLVSKIKENREKRQILTNFVQDIENQIELVKNLGGQIDLNRSVESSEITKVFEVDKVLKSEIEAFYKFRNEETDKLVNSSEGLRNKIEGSNVKKELENEEKKLKEGYANYCKTQGVVINQEEYRKQEDRIKLITKSLDAIESQLKEIESERKRYKELSGQLSLERQLFIEENNKLLTKFNESFKTTSVSAIWEEVGSDRTSWLKDQFLESNKELKDRVEKNFKVKSPVREDYIIDIVEELSQLYGEDTVDKIRNALSREGKLDLSLSTGKKENLSWFFEKNETQIIREDLIMRLGEYAGIGRNYIKYGNKILGRDNMSFGERCGTLTELLLFSGDHPLIIDQPEDHLDAKFVADKVVNLVRHRKINRQVIICTHNANIVVLGDSELVTTLSVDNESKVSVLQGPLEDIQVRRTIYDVLEGGATAFKKREQKYGEAIG